MALPADRRGQIEEIVFAALALAEPQRKAHLDSACAGDRELRREVESLLEQETRARSFLETPAIEAAARALAARHSASLPGRVTGPYRIDALLGVGGMGEVYRAWDTRLRRPVALKFLAVEFLSDASAVERFEREARAASALSHPNICTVYDVGEMDGRPFIAMEYLEGQNLRALLGGTPMPRRTAIKYAIQIAQGLAAAHEKGIVHRDLKPENLWVTREGRLRILDFGLAKVSQPENSSDSDKASIASEPGRAMGTVGYMSPEQLRGQPVDHRTDVFSFGAVLYEMLSGKRAFHEPSPIDTQIAILNAQPPELPDPATNRLVRRCLEKDPRQRFASASDLAANLEAVLDAKRVLFPRRRLLQAAGGVAAFAALSAIWASRTRFTTRRITRLAVLPLTSSPGGVEQQAFADGMTDLLITDLGQIGALRVISRPSVMRFKDTKQPLSEISKQLGVEAVIVGSVRSSPNQVRITAQLVDPATGQQLWAHAYERELTDVLALQSDVARAIAAEIQARVTPEESGRLSRNRKVVPAALGEYLLGRHDWDQFTEESIWKAIGHYEQAIRLDPAYAAAYAGIAQCWGGILFTDARPWDEAISNARDAATKALELDDGLAEAHQAMAEVHYHAWDWRGVEEEVKKAIALNTGFPVSHMQYSNMLRHLGRADESIAEAKLALEVDPLSMLSNQMLGNAYLSARRYDLAIARFQKGLELHPGNSGLQYHLGWAYVYGGAFDKGIQSIRASLAADGVDPDLSPDLAFIAAMRGQRDQTRQVLTRLLALARTVPVSPGMIALVYIALDEREPALDWLEKAYGQHSSMMTWLKTDPRFDRIRAEPRFQDLMQRVGLI